MTAFISLSIKIILKKQHCPFSSLK